MIRVRFFFKKLSFGFAVLVLFMAAACFSEPARENPGRAEPAPEGEFFPAAYGGTETYAAALEELAERERSGGIEPGLGLTESMLREGLGDYGGAVVAAYKELSWAYGAGGAISRSGIAGGLEAVLALYEGEGSLDPPLGEEARERALGAVRGLIAFHNGRWTEARLYLESLCAAGDEPDSFAQWLCLVCRLEEGEASRQATASYGAIRARYEGFPEYWYRGARNFSGSLHGNIRREYAERCINLAPQGPFAAECRGILVETMGLPVETQDRIKTLAEIEGSVIRSVSSDTPELLRELFGLLSLQDNPYTLYAAGALRALAVQEDFKAWFVREAAGSSGRLAERLFYISRG
jgi:hypothetical protein